MPWWFPKLWHWCLIFKFTDSIWSSTSTNWRLICLILTGLIRNVSLRSRNTLLCLFIIGSLEFWLSSHWASQNCWYSDLMESALSTAKSSYSNNFFSLSLWLKFGTVACQVRRKWKRKNLCNPKRKMLWSPPLNCHLFIHLMLVCNTKSQTPQRQSSIFWWFLVWALMEFTALTTSATSFTDLNLLGKQGLFHKTMV